MTSKLIDLDALAKESKDFDPIPTGTYTAKCAETNVKTNASGNKYIKAQYVITGGPQDGRYLWNNYNDPTNYAKGARWFFSEAMKAHGILGGQRSMEWLADNMVGETVKITIDGHREYNGRKYENISKVAAASQSQPGPGGKLTAGSRSPAKPSFLD